MRVGAPAAAAVDVIESYVNELALCGCCAVCLYDSRHRRGLRGVVEPVARRGRADCVVRYAGRRYAMHSDKHVERFMRRPWLFREGGETGVRLPDPLKCPLTQRERDTQLLRPSEEGGMAESEYIRRTLYESVAQAMLAVSRARPRYPGLSAEESALKFMALYMKAHHPGHGAVAAAQYREAFELFQRRAQLPRRVWDSVRAVSQEEGGAASARQLRERDSICDDYEGLLYGNVRMNDFIHLRYSGEVVCDCTRERHRGSSYALGKRCKHCVFVSR